MILILKKSRVDAGGKGINENGSLISQKDLENVQNKIKPVVDIF